jgi:hypothetical protein
MAEAVTEELGPDICAYKDEELEKTLKSRPPIRYFVSPLTIESFSDRPAHIGLSSGREGSSKVEVWSDLWQVIKRPRQLNEAFVTNYDQDFNNGLLQDTRL